MDSNLVIFEGIDAVGKTTLAKLLAQRTGGIYYKTPPESFRQRCANIDSGGVVYNEERFQLYLDGCHFASKEIKEMLGKGKVVIIDRWIWTTLAYHFAHNLELYKKWSGNWQVLTSGLLRPRVSILLFISDDKIWLERAKRRGIDKADRAVVQNEELRKRIFQLYTELNPYFYLIDNSGSIDKSLRAVSDLIKK